jgi:predicted O-methyltransferase YrrM
VLGSSLDGSSLVRAIKRALPRRLKAAAKEGLRRLLFRRYMNQAVRSPSLLANAAFLADIREAWGNVDYSAAVPFLIEALARVRGRPQDSVLECGSGISTILMGLALPRSAASEIWALENDVRWLKRVAAVTKSYPLSNVRLIHTPLQSYGDYLWYAPPRQRMPRFHLVICDGPTQATPGGRYGLLPVMTPHLTDDAVVLFDDADTAIGRAVLARWQDEGLARVELREGSDGVFAIVTVQKRLEH